ncbi:MAG: endonuclease III [Desulfobacterales bacterium]|nr:endonuclease III [Desulfobacterales bacterium]
MVTNKSNSFTQEEKVKIILGFLDREYPDARCSLNYRNPFELLIATILSAQCTDKRVNEVTKELFRKYRKPEDFLKISIKELETEIRSTGFFRNKAKNIMGCCQRLIVEHNGQVPQTLMELVALPGVGRKTANVVLGDAFGIPGIVVDTHAGRLSRRLGLTKESKPEKVESDLMGIIPKKSWTKFCHQLISHGRALCTARKPKCDLCDLIQICEYPNSKEE